MNHLRNIFINSMEQWRCSNKLSMEEMAHKLDISLSKYKRLLTGDSATIDLDLICNLYRLTGMLAFEFAGESDQYLDIGRKIRLLSPSQQEFISKVVDFELELKAENNEGSAFFIPVLVPTGNMEDGMLYDSANLEQLDISSYISKYPDVTAAIRITSGHLSPTYLKGDILLVSHSSIRDGDTGLFLNGNNGCVYIRKYIRHGQCRLEPINSYGETFLVDPEEPGTGWIRFGKVVAKIR